VLYFVVMVGAAALSLRTARSVFAPMERMDSTMQKVQSGDLHARVGAVHSRDEVGRLARHLDELLGTQQRWHEALDAKVAERTAQLQATQQQLVRSEKLATIGQLTASIAHEVNNPIAVLQGNLDLLRELLPPDALAPVQGELKLMDEQIERMRLIVTQLLQFARPGEYAGYVQRVAPAAVLADCLVLVGHQLASSRIAVVQERPATQAVAINRQELQQVLVNLLVNAVHAMPEGGRLTLRCADAEPGWVHLQVQDSGPGLAPALLNDLFQPFVTGKKDGTGLGLWISRSLVERYGGDITAANAESGGAVFTVRLKAAP
jgi:C4-dicarboxylate-specific signal transduction histidine kinase